MVKTTVDDRRGYERAKRVLSIQYRLKKSPRKGADHEWHLSTTHDMSFGGVAFYTSEEYRVGETLEIRVVMSGILDIFNGLAEVVRVEQKRAGNYFLIAVKFAQASKVSRPAKSYHPPKKRSAKRI